MVVDPALDDGVPRGAHVPGDESRPDRALWGIGAIREVVPEGDFAGAERCAYDRLMARARIRVRRVALSGDQRCPLCREGFGEPAEELAVCGGCDAVHHLDCAEEFGGGACATCSRPLCEAMVPSVAETEDDGWTLVLFEPQGFLEGQLLLWVTGLVTFSGVMTAAFTVMTMRWPPWTLAVACVLPLVVYGLAQYRRSVAGLSRARHRRPKTKA